VEAITRPAAPRTVTVAATVTVTATATATATVTATATATVTVTATATATDTRYVRAVTARAMTAPSRTITYPRTPARRAHPLRGEEYDRS